MHKKVLSSEAVVYDTPKTHQNGVAATDDKTFPPKPQSAVALGGEKSDGWEAERLKNESGYLLMHLLGTCAYVPLRSVSSCI